MCRMRSTQSNTPTGRLTQSGACSAPRPGTRRRSICDSWKLATRTAGRLTTRASAPPSWHVQTMFGRNRADVVLPVVIDQRTSPAEPIRGMIGVGAWGTQAEFKDIKVTKGDKTLFAGVDGFKYKRGQWAVVD